MMSEEKEKKRPGPLDLSRSEHIPDSEKDMSTFALQCVSPGLPPLSAKMQTTVLQSKSIEQQQRQIIAQRAGVLSSPSDDHAVDGCANAESLQRATPSTSGLTSNMESLSIPLTSSNKRLKRDRVPTPLNLGSARTQQPQTIRSAPIYNFSQPLSPQTAQRANFKRAQRQAVHAVGSQRAKQQPHQQALLTANPHRAQIPFVNASHPQYTAMNNVYRRVPQTATIMRHPGQGMPFSQRQWIKYQQQLAYQHHQWSKFKKYQNSQAVSHVTDVFPGEGQRFAPLEAQALSSQRCVFDTEVKAQTITKEHGRKRNHDDEELDDDDPESAAIEDDAEVGIITGIQKEQIVSAELKLANNVFRFELERHGGLDKERFLNHCATAWDQFNKV
ncbi:unnamed protein product [Cyberlindnera jadinii]|uniref:Uncharacterized protein n=1 Tax=Cyberlindnera jadinii (strain ATCC 18201 / CBS 1600 / BCRC 20928 / JCM 3617 / NBRC 0987 / NRRL Y-1542) TaxID=983966 RepID=A0A0H5C6N6_CYBJN|nr:unnamed protein product [Cyberlindnera jadinii]